MKAPLLSAGTSQQPAQQWLQHYIQDDTSRSRYHVDASRSRHHIDFQVQVPTTPPGPGTVMMPSDQAMEVFQKKGLSLLIDLRNQHKYAQPTSSAVQVERMETIEDLDREEERRYDLKAFDAL
ncbi:hypothetical protein GOODEAATRI_022929, partial [Goodea atripinnis]